MLSENYGEYNLTSLVRKEPNGRFSVGVRIKREIKGKEVINDFFARDGIFYILEIEAEKESINLGKNLIDRGHS